MKYKVLVYSYSFVVEAGLTFLVKKSIPNAEIISTKSLDFLPFVQSDFICDLYVFYIFHQSEVNLICNHFSTYFKDFKIVFIVKNSKMKLQSNIIRVNYIYWNSSEDQIIKQLRKLIKMSNVSLIDEQSKTKNIKDLFLLSEREMQCTKLLVEGYSVSQISKQLSLKVNTVSTYKMRVHKKTNTSNLVQLINILYKIKHVR